MESADYGIQTDKSFTPRATTTDTTIVQHIMAAQVENGVADLKCMHICFREKQNINFC